MASSLHTTGLQKLSRLCTAWLSLQLHALFFLFPPYACVEIVIVLQQIASQSLLVTTLLLITKYNGCSGVGTNRWKATLPSSRDLKRGTILLVPPFGLALPLSHILQLPRGRCHPSSSCNSLSDLWFPPLCYDGHDNYDWAILPNLEGASCTEKGDRKAR